MIGLPSGSSGEGPATTAACLFVALVTAAGFAALLAMLVYAVRTIG